MRRLNKRGMDDKLTFVIWEAIVILMVIIVLTISVKGIANNTNYWKKYHSADLALMTDVIIAGQGDFVVNYDLKYLRQNFATKALRIDPLVFQILLKDDAFFIYDTSIDKDRFPQSYIFAKDKDVKISKSNTSNNYIVMYKKENEVGMKNSIISEITACPSQDTKDIVEDKQFDIISFSEGTKDYSQYINSAVSVGKGQNKDWLIALTNTTTGPTIIYHNPSDIRGKKMSCILQRQLSENLPNIDINFRTYDNSFEIQPFMTQKNDYSYWMLIKLNTDDITNNDLKNISISLEGAITEYYK